MSRVDFIENSLMNNSAIFKMVTVALGTGRKAFELDYFTLSIDGINFKNKDILNNLGLIIDR